MSPLPRRGRRSSELGLTDLFDDGLPTAVPAAERASLIRRLGRLPKFAVGSLAVGLLIAGLSIPFVLPPTYVARQVGYSWEDLPKALPLDAQLPLSSVLTDRDGKTFAVFFGQNRSPVRLNQVSHAVIDALLATEDDRFYTHGAVDLAGLARALVHNQTSTSKQGGSGITQQYVKNLLLSQATTADEERAVTEQTFARKIRELKYAVEIEKALSKDEILARYLNTVNFGDGAYGIGAAAKHYFGIPASKISVAQAAVLVGILKSPTNYNPVDHPEAARERRNIVLGRMLATHRISQAQFDSAHASVITLKITDPPQGCGASAFPFYCQWITEIIANDPSFGATPEARQELLYRGGLKIRTALDRGVMAIAQAAADRALKPTNRVATGIAVVQPGTGQVLALVTNRRWGRDAALGETQIVLPARPAFQPGSNFKPITLATALEGGFSLATKFNTPDGYVPTNMNYPKGGFHNDNNRNNGILNAYQATAKSVNTWFVQLEERVGVLPIADMAGRLGMTSLPRSGKHAITARDAALTLGAYETSPLQMATVYATFASGGITCTPSGVLAMTDRKGASLPVPPVACRRTLSPYVAAAVTDVMRGVLTSNGTGAGFDLGPQPAAAKTGTTNDSAATWFSGFTPQYAMSVWIGDPRGGQKYPLHNIEAYGHQFGKVYGRTVAGPIWHEAMLALHASLPVEPFAAPATTSLTGLTPPVPDVRGLSRDAAITALLQAGFQVTLVKATAKADPALPSGQVAAQQPSAGTTSSYDSVVRLTLTAGSDTSVTVPKLWQLTPTG
ncbi:MAG: penicillin-binding protein [Actinomycetes bacterium]